MLRYNPWAVQVYQRICGGQKTRKKTAIIALARKLLVRCWAMLRRKEPWQDDTLKCPPIFGQGAKSSMLVHERGQI